MREDLVWYPHKNIFSFFMSTDYSDLLRVKGCVSYPTTVERSVGEYKVAVVDTLFVKAVADFLNGDRSDYGVHLEKRDFLGTKLKLFEEGLQVRSPPQWHTFHYSLYIDRIIFDHEQERAFVQYSFKNKSSEALFQLDKENWTLVRRTDVNQY